MMNASGRMMLLHRARSRATGLSLVEWAVVLAVLALLAFLGVLLVIVVPRVKKQALVARARADIRSIATALQHYQDDLGVYPASPFERDGRPTRAHADNVLYEALTNRHAGGEAGGWAGASREWQFIHSANTRTYSAESQTKRQVLDPWGRPYYYIPHSDYLEGVRIHDELDTTPGGVPNCFGATDVPDDFQGSDTPDPADDDRSRPPRRYRGPPPVQDVFRNPATFQLHSKGPDQLTDIDDGEPAVDACDRGLDADDINNYRR